MGPFKNLMKINLLLQIKIQVGKHNMVEAKPHVSMEPKKQFLISFQIVHYRQAQILVLDIGMVEKGSILVKPKEKQDLTRVIVIEILVPVQVAVIIIERTHSHLVLVRRILGLLGRANIQRELQVCALDTPVLMLQSIRMDIERYQMFLLI